MPLNVQPVVRLESIPIEERKAMSFQHQEHWYRLAARLCQGLSVLDVGAGTGYGLPILKAAGAARICGIDPLPAGPEVDDEPLSAFDDASHDIVLAIDVIEHVEDDRGFLSDLLRVARKLAFISTPNWNEWRCTNKYHFREYTPDELCELLKNLEYALWTCGKNRIGFPIRPIHAASEALASFGITIRAPSCPDEDWNEILSARTVLRNGISQELSCITRDADEWASMAEQIVAGSSGPLEASLRAIQWLTTVLQNKPPAELKDETDTIVILRRGLAGQMQQARSIAWVLNNFVIGPDGPVAINHPRGNR